MASCSEVLTHPQSTCSGSALLSKARVFLNFYYTVRLQKRFSLLSMFQQEAWSTWPFLAGLSGSFFRAVHDLSPMQHALPACYCHYNCFKATRLTQLCLQPAPCSSWADSFTGVQRPPNKKRRTETTQKHRVCLESRSASPLNLPISIFSTASCTVTSGEDTVFTKGYRLHTTTLRIEGENWVIQQETTVPNWAWQAQDITSDFMVLSLRSGTSIKSCGQEWCSAQGQVMVQVTVAFSWTLCIKRCQNHSLQQPD